MDDKTDADKNVKIHAPDLALHAKIGVPTLDKILTPEVVAAAQGVIQQSSDQFLAICLARMGELERACSMWRKAPQEQAKLLPGIIDAVFSIKTKAGFGGYDLVASLAKSLQWRCEQLKDKKPAARDMDIIQWHIESMDQLMKNRVKGKGGAAGADIIAELERLSGGKIP